MNWYYEDIEIIKGYPDWFDHIKEVEEGRERKLIITDIPLEAAGKFTCKTNTDETECKLRVVPENEFLKPLEDQETMVKDQVGYLLSGLCI